MFCFASQCRTPGLASFVYIVCQVKAISRVYISRKCKTVELLDAMFLQRSGSLTGNANKYLKTEPLMTPTAVFCNLLDIGILCKSFIWHEEKNCRGGQAA